MKTRIQNFACFRFPLVVATVLVLLLIEFSGHPLHAQDARESTAEIWYGVLDLQVTKLRLEIRIKKQADGSLGGALYSLDQTSQPFPCDMLTLDQDKFAWNVNSLGASFAGKLNSSRDAAVGEFKQGGVVAKMEFKKVEKVPPRKLVQAWQGNMQAGPQEFDFQFRVYKDADGTETVFLDSFTENVGDLMCDLTHEDNQVTIDVPITQGKFVGTLNETHDTIAGTWFQRGVELPLTLKSFPLKKVRKITLRRPQTPQPPFDYDSEELKIKNEAGNSVLAGTLTTPAGAGPFPVVVMISGSGPQDRDETIYGHKPFFVIADHLAKAGIAVFRYDDRGVGQSQGVFTTATSADFASDVNAILDRLKKHAKVDPQRIVLAGHSEGGIVAPMVASARDDVAGLILLAGTGVDGEKITLSQSRIIAAGAGAPPEILQIQDQLLVRLFARIEQQQDFDQAFLDGLVEELTQALPEELRESANLEALVRQSPAKLDSPWFKFFAAHDPGKVLEKISCPVLIVIGEKDTQVDPKLNLPPMKAALARAGNEDVEVREMPGLNHLFQKCENGLPTEYLQIEETISPEVLDLIADWLGQRIK